MEKENDNNSEIKKESNIEKEKEDTQTESQTEKEKPIEKQESQTTSQTKPQTEKNEEEKDEDEEGDKMPEYINPLNEKGELCIPLKTKNKYRMEDFDVIALSGKGAYGTVLKVKFKSDKEGKFYAIKSMDILALDRIKKLYQAYLECDILSQLQSPYIVDVLGSFDEKKKIYIVMQYISKGDFSDFIRLNYPLKPDTIQFYAGEIVNFLEYIQSKKIVHRDLKPENIMMNENWHLQVIDFATARVLGKYFDKKSMEFKIDTYYNLSENDNPKGNKVVISEEEDDDDIDKKHSKPERRGMTFVGTAEYVSPEVLAEKPAGFGSDIWALGIMIYQMYFGKTPFKDKTNYLIFRKIEELKLDFPENVKISEEAKDLINKILVKDPEKRLGAGEPGTEYDITHLKAHPYFKDLDWDNLYKLTPPNSKNFDYLMSKTEKPKTEASKQQIRHSVPIPILKKESGNQGEVLKEGFLEKKSRWLYYNKRKAILYSTPKLVLIDPSTDKIHGEIILDKKVKINHVSMNIFDLISPVRNYRFKTDEGEALIWEKSIIEAIKTYNK